jgi:hypothetical protein
MTRRTAYHTAMQYKLRELEAIASAPLIRIEDAARMGKFSVEYVMLKENQRAALVELGFTVDGITIYWDEEGSDDGSKQA